MRWKCQRASFGIKSQEPAVLVQMVFLSLLWNVVFIPTPLFDTWTTSSTQTRNTNHTSNLRSDLISLSIYRSDLCFLSPAMFSCVLRCPRGGLTSYLQRHSLVNVSKIQTRNPAFSMGTGIYCISQKKSVGEYNQLWTKNGKTTLLFFSCSCSFQFVDLILVFW